MAIKYIIKPEEKRVIAVLENTRNDAINKAVKICKKISELSPRIFIAPQTKELIMNNSFHGVATCQDGDVFDIEEGKKIAKRICLEKYYNSFDNKMDKFYFDLESLGLEIKNLVDNEI